MASTLLILFVVSLVAALFDAIAGGGGLITLPALILAGLDPVAAVATNKLQSSCGSVAATIVFARHGYLARRIAWIIAACAFGASILGAVAVSHVPRDFLTIAMPFALLGVAAYFTWARPSEEEATARLPASIFAIAYAPMIGFYDGIFGPGAGSFYTIGFVALLGYGLTRATAHAKLLNAASNLGALAFFATSGRIVWPVGLVMAAGALIGAQIGARLGLRNGARLIRPLVVAVCVVLAIKLLLDAYRRGLFAGG